MKKTSYQQYIKEVDNWLHRGRRLLLEANLQRALAGRTDDLNILEVGAGSGNNIQVLQRFGTVDAVEIEPMGLEQLQQNSAVRQIYSSKVPFALEQKYDLICAMDFLEHVENDQQVFDWMVDHLADDGVMFITVPAYQFLFSDHDVALQHFRRYRVGQLLQLNNGGLLVLKKGISTFFCSRWYLPVGWWQSCHAQNRDNVRKINRSAVSRVWWTKCFLLCYRLRLVCSNVCRCSPSA
jgi:SAM-dependent methyltransferase